MTGLRVILAKFAAFAVASLALLLHPGQHDEQRARRRLPRLRGRVHRRQRAAPRRRRQGRRRPGRSGPGDRGRRRLRPGQLRAERRAAAARHHQDRDALPEPPGAAVPRARAERGARRRARGRRRPCRSSGPTRASTSPSCSTGSVRCSRCWSRPTSTSWRPRWSRCSRARAAPSRSLLQQTAELTNFVADRDDVYSDVVTNLTPVLDNLAGQGDQFTATVQELRALMTGLARDRRAIGSSIDGVEPAGRLDVGAAAGRPRAGDRFDPRVREGGRHGGPHPQGRSTPRSRSSGRSSRASAGPAPTRARSTSTRARSSWSSARRSRSTRPATTDPGRRCADEATLRARPVPDRHRRHRRRRPGRAGDPGAERRLVRHQLLHRGDRAHRRPAQGRGRAGPRRRASARSPAYA